MAAVTVTNSVRVGSGVCVDDPGCVVVTLFEGVVVVPLLAPTTIVATAGFVLAPEIVQVYVVVVPLRTSRENPPAFAEMVPVAEGTTVAVSAGIGIAEPCDTAVRGLVLAVA
ncbi:hypothetical protein J5X84_14235 [Streptosporangiaceae bacterium NEAU-GS5]|nr:hypothetical protein [Streptosporangiaceae bacterium NEAU-GS5]